MNSTARPLRSAPTGIDTSPARSPSRIARPLRQRKRAIGPRPIAKLDRLHMHHAPTPRVLGHLRPQLAALPQRLRIHTQPVSSSGVEPAVAVCVHSPNFAGNSGASAPSTPPTPAPSTAQPHPPQAPPTSPPAPLPVLSLKPNPYRAQTTPTIPIGSTPPDCPCRVWLSSRKDLLLCLCLYFSFCHALWESASVRLLLTTLAFSHEAKS